LPWSNSQFKTSSPVGPGHSRMRCQPPHWQGIHVSIPCRSGGGARLGLICHRACSLKRERRQESVDPDGCVIHSAGSAAERKCGVVGDIV
jgi:hypothetical protein